jgi:hypothetical protein
MESCSLDTITLKEQILFHERLFIYVVFKGKKKYLQKFQKPLDLDHTRFNIFYLIILPLLIIVNKFDLNPILININKLKPYKLIFGISS